MLRVLEPLNTSTSHRHQPGCGDSTPGRAGSNDAALGAPELEVLIQTVVAQAPRLHDENIAAVRAGWHAMAAQLQETSA